MAEAGLRREHRGWCEQGRLTLPIKIDCGHHWGCQYDEVSHPCFFGILLDQKHWLLSLYNLTQNNLLPPAWNPATGVKRIPHLMGSTVTQTTTTMKTNEKPSAKYTKRSLGSTPKRKWHSNSSRWPVRSPHTRRANSSVQHISAPRTTDTAPERQTTNLFGRGSQTDK